MSGYPNTTLPSRSQSDFINLLPKEESIPPTKIPINKDQERLDYYIPPPTPESLALFKARTGQKKLCNNFHINGTCDNNDCPYDHRPITEGIRDCLRGISLSQPCPRRGGCRSKGCTHGHICQKAECKYAKYPSPPTRPMLTIYFADIAEAKSSASFRLQSTWSTSTRSSISSSTTQAMGRTKNHWHHRSRASVRPMKTVRGCFSMIRMLRSIRDRCLQFF